jgi:endonuclease YncB( thermonuclease family)|tara:strand:+ start:944 stop:1759 length:816 start_codon:yes stop_codon:yes gene_type:complete
MKFRLVIYLALTPLLSAFSAGTFTGKVTGITDGDTLTVTTVDKRTFKIRLAGIDAPENGQPFADNAKQALADKTLNKQVTVTWTKLDEYQRLIASLYIGSTSINQQMISEGWAWHYLFYNKDPLLAAAQTRARSARKGLWVAKKPVAPWEWRRRSKSGGPKPKPGAVRIVSLLPNPKGKDEGNEQVTLANTTKKNVSLRGWLLRDKRRNTYKLTGSIKANGRLVITLKNNSMPLNNQGDTITLMEGKTVRQTVSYNKRQAGDGAVVKAGKK